MINRRELRTAAVAAQTLAGDDERTSLNNKRTLEYETPATVE